ncbi:hypothetical protein M433DRAFT_154911 [Acidomyces richmondensis BFW]|nr:MAG: hypothetical protein FE78DRAFT_91304 [Acidomyces sp. 'richmondensis']KYG45087.1 hypothetical protein M433DRAFT_154911 [Acidomyces richmondensis BFW]
MSTTTTAAAAPPTIDLREPATYPIRLGASLFSGKQNNAVKQYISLRRNHTPRATTGRKTTATLLPASFTSASSSAPISHDRSQFIVREEGQEVPWRYVDTSQREELEYILVVRPTAAGKEVVLERLGGSWESSLVDTSEVETADVRGPDRQAEEEDDELFGDGESDEHDEAPLLEDNPFDYRHFLPGARTTAPAMMEDRKQKDPSCGTTRKNDSSIRNPSATVATTSASPLPAARPPSKGRPESSLYMSPDLKKRKAAATLQGISAKKPKHSDNESRSPPRMSKDKPSHATPNQLQAANKTQIPASQSLRSPPQIRASPPGADDNDDDGELILENEPSPPSTRPAKRNGAMGLALTGQLLGLGPISLRSAASSPAARRDVKDGDAEAEAEAADEEEEAEEREEGEQEEKEGEQVEGDADVDDLTLGSPAHGMSGLEVEDDDDDLDAQLAAAIAAEGVGLEVESEESEEE